MKTTILLVSLTIAAAVQAAEPVSPVNPALTLPGATSSEAKPDLATASQANTRQGAAQIAFGAYLLEPQLQAVPTGSSSDALATLGDWQIARAAAAATPARLTADTVVRNQFTGELGVMTGRVSIVASNAQLLTELTQRFGLQSLKSLRHGKVQLLQAPAGADLAALLSALQQQAGVEWVQLDVLENTNTPQ